MTVDVSFWERVRPDDLFAKIAAEENRIYVVGVLRQLSYDSIWTDPVIRKIEVGEIETQCFLSWLARELQPRIYLEVGVRRGFSMSMVATRSLATQIVGFDMWVPNYAGSANPGKDFVQAELRRLGYRKAVEFHEGNSHKTLPRYFRGGRSGLLPRWFLWRRAATAQSAFDLALIDGDHSLLGAAQDLRDVMSQCPVGGVVVFDDILPDLAGTRREQWRIEWGHDPYGWRDLLGVWRAIQKEFSKFRYFEYLKNPPGVGVAVRLT